MSEFTEKDRLDIYGSFDAFRKVLYGKLDTVTLSNASDHKTREQVRELRAINQKCRLIVSNLQKLEILCLQ